MRPVSIYTALVLALVAATSLLFAVAYAAPEARTGIAVAAVVAVVLQPAMFVIARRFTGTQFLAGWGIGAMACAVALVGLGLALRAAGLPQDGPMLALATSLFLTELVEPLLLQQS